MMVQMRRGGKREWRERRTRTLYSIVHSVGFSFHEQTWQGTGNFMKGGGTSLEKSCVHWYFPRLLVIAFLYLITSKYDSMLHRHFEYTFTYFQTWWRKRELVQVLLLCLSVIVFVPLGSLPLPSSPWLECSLTSSTKVLNRVSQKIQKSEFWNATYPSGFHRLDEPPEKISAL